MSIPPPFPPANQPPSGPSAPPGFGQPGAQPPGGFVPGPGIAVPPWQTGGTRAPTGLTPQPGRVKRSKAPLIVGAVLIVAILVVVGVLVLSGDDDSGGGGGIKSAAAASGLEALLRDGSFDAEGLETLRNCPLGDVDDLTAAVGKVLDLDDAVVDGDPENGLTEEGDLPGFVACQINAADDVRDGPSGLFFQAISDPPRDYEDYITEFSGDLTSLNFEDTVEYKGGEVFLFCGEAIEEDGYTGCDADWVSADDNIALNVFIAGADVKTEDAFAALKEVIVTMADNLSELATDES